MPVSGQDRGRPERCAIIAGYSPKYARSHSWALVGVNRQASLSKQLWDMVAAKREEIGEKWGITEQEIMDGYIRDERFDPIDLVNPETGLPETDLRNIPKAARLSLKGLKVRQQILKSEGESQVIKQTSEFQYPDKKGNRDSMAKILGLLTEKKHHTGEVTVVHKLLDTIAGSQEVDELPNLTQEKI